jgi:SAM-dependent methyltransferase
MGLRDVQAHWNEFGIRDPLWAILTLPGKQGNQWDAEEFFNTGRTEISELMQRVSVARRRVLDFGCGVGRLTQALAAEFDEACGVDIAPSMIELAVQYNRHGERCKYILNAQDDLRCFPAATFDMVHSRITLQHMQPRFIRRYLREFVRVVAPGGVIVFNLPSERIGGHVLERMAWFLRYRVLWSVLHRGEPRMDMYGVPRKNVVRLMQNCGAELLAADPDIHIGPEWNSFVYMFRKPAAGG